MLIRKIDIKLAANFTENIEDDNVNPYIHQAERYDFKPKLGTSMIAVLSAASVASAAWTTWELSEAPYITANQIVIHNENIYQLAVASTSAEPGTNADWTLKELYSFWYEHVRQYMAYCTLGRFLLWHGKNITQEGIREPFEDSSSEVDSRGKGTMIAACKSMASTEQNLLMKKIELVNWTFDGTAYARPTNPPNRGLTKKFGFYPI
jgi:hypothetical protein